MKHKFTVVIESNDDSEDREVVKCDVCWIASIVPKRGYKGYTGEIDVRINPAKKDGTRSNREFVLWDMEIDSIKKID